MNRLGQLIKAHDALNELDIILPEIENEITKSVWDNPIMLKVNTLGIDLLKAARVVNEIDIDRLDKLSYLWRYAGAEPPIDGKRFNGSLRKACLMLTDELLHNRFYCNDFQAIVKEYDDREGSNWTTERCYKAARRRMVKLFLKHLWLFWRDYAGINYLNSDDRKELVQYGWL